MSVWEGTTYKLEMARSIYTNIPDYTTRILGSTIGQYVMPRGELVPFTATDTWEDVAQELEWERLELDDADTEVLNELLGPVKHWSVGVQGVYELIHAALNGRFEVKAQYNYALMDRRIRVIGNLLAASTMITPPAFMAKWDACDRETLLAARCMEDFAEAWKFYTRSMRAGKHELLEIDQDKYFGTGNRNYYGVSIGPLVILRGSALYAERGVVLTKRHLDLVIGSALRISGILEYTAREYAGNVGMRKRVRRMLDLTVSSAFRCSRFNADKVVQAFHKARAYVQMTMFDNEMEDALTEACLEFQKKNLQTVLDLAAYVSLFKDLPKGRWLDLLHIYKWMPPPDFDSTYAFQDLYELHMSTRISALDNGASSEMKKLWRIVVRERKLNTATAYLKLNNCWPSGLALEDNFPTEASLDSWEPTALFPYYTYGKDVTAQIKDKATVLPKLVDEVRMEGRKAERNFLLWFLMHRDTIDTVEIAQALQKGTLAEDNYVRVAYKGESHKPGSRLFFMAPPRQRLVLGELEGNISRIASVYPASLQGVDALTKAKKLEKLFSLELDSFSVDTEEPYTGYIVTFDLAKFSPRFNPAVLRNLHEYWARVFSYPPIVAYGKLGAESTILHTTNRLVMQYKNKGADLEGFRGRMMTLFHADLIAAACRYASSLGYLIGRSHSAVFIDDGAVKIAAAGTGNLAKSNALGFLECMQKVYEAAGQENHPNKTIVSATGGELLAEQFIYGQRMKCAIKAGMRLHPPYELPANAITEEFDALFSTAQGSVKDGGDWVVTYRRLADGYMKAIHRWGRREFPMHTDVHFAFRFVTPKSMGGFGFPSLQALVTTTAYDLTVEGLGILSAAAKSYSVYEPEVNKILNRSVVVRSPLQIFRDPGRVRLTGDILIEGRLNSMILRKLRERRGPWTGLIVLMRDQDLVEHAEAVAKALLSQDTVSLPLMARAWDCVPLSYVESLILKFQRSSSVQTLLPERDILAVRRANQNDVRKLLKAYF